MDKYLVEIDAEIKIDGTYRYEIEAISEDEAEDKAIELMKSGMLDDEIIEELLEFGKAGDLYDWDLEVIGKLEEN